jgi:arylsulfatase A-like enzyme
MISRRTFLQRASLLGLASAVLPPIAQSEVVKPNFLFILADDLGWKDLGCYGSSFYETPNLDRLAATGMRFTNAYAACPVCSPTRASILSGKYPARTATTDWFGAPQPDTAHKHKGTRFKPLLPAQYTPELSLEEENLAEALKASGYATFFAGKWHLGHEAFHPENQGFDVNKGGHHKGSPHPGGYFAPYGNPTLEDGPEGEHLPDRLARETNSFIDAHRDAPFLAYLSFYSVHTPLQSRKDLTEKYKAKKAAMGDLEPIWGEEGARKLRLVQEHAVYAGMVEAMDAAIGTVLDHLEESGLADNTVVFFMSDNGGLSTSEGHPTSNLPLRAGKGWLYEGGIREPMLVRAPGHTKPASLCDTPVTSTDFYPTMLELAGLPAKPKQHVDGESMVPLLKGGDALKRDAIYWHYPHYGNQGGTPGAAIREGDWKLIEYFEDKPVELFNLAKDMGETRNLAGEQPERVAQLRGKLDAWQKDVGARFPTPNPNAKPG